MRKPTVYQHALIANLLRQLVRGQRRRSCDAGFSSSFFERDRQGNTVRKIVQTIREQVQPPGRRNRMLVMMMNVIVLLSASILASSCPLLSGCRSTNIFTNPGSNETIQNIKRQNTDEKTRTGEFFVLFIPKTVRHAVRARVREQRAGAKQSQLSGKICFRTSPVLFLGRSKSGVAEKTQERGDTDRDERHHRDDKGRQERFQNRRRILVHYFQLFFFFRQKMRK